MKTIEYTKDLEDLDVKSSKSDFGKGIKKIELHSSICNKLDSFFDNINSVFNHNVDGVSKLYPGFLLDGNSDEGFKIKYRCFYNHQVMYFSNIKEMIDFLNNHIGDKFFQIPIEIVTKQQIFVQAKSLNQAIELAKENIEVLSSRLDLGSRVYLDCSFHVADGKYGKGTTKEAVKHIKESKNKTEEGNTVKCEIRMIPEWEYK